jgi:hypothetical protein
MFSRVFEEGKSRFLENREVLLMVIPNGIYHELKM